MIDGFVKSSLATGGTMRANQMVGATRRVARYRAARRAAPTFGNDEVEAQSRSKRD